LPAAGYPAYTGMPYTSQQNMPGINLGNTQTAFAHRSNAELLKMELLFSVMNNPGLNRLAVNSLLLSIRWHMPVKALVKNTIFQHFCGGETIEECLDNSRKLARFGVGTILDYSVEGEKNEAGFEKVMKETLRTIEVASGNKDIPFAVFKTSGIAPVDLLEKLQGGKQLSSEESSRLESARKRFSNICSSAAKKKVRLFVDAEESWIQDVIDQWTYEEMAIHNRETAIVFNTFQLYRSDMLENLKQAFAEAEKGGYFMGAKLVRGAYMEKEAAFAAKAGIPDPIQPDKQSCDEDYNAALEFCLRNVNRLHFCAGSHNEESNLLLARGMQEMGLEKNDSRIWFAQLLGMSDNISYTLAGLGFNIAKYVPYGPVFSVMPYLVRRAAENTSVAGQTSRELRLISAERKRRKTQ
jgi:proline dehydrogenase